MIRPHPFVPGVGASLNTCQDCGCSADAHALALMLERALPAIARSESHQLVDHIARMFPSPHRFSEPHL